MEEERRIGLAAAAIIPVVDARGGEEHDHDDDDVARGSCSCCNLCGDVGFRQALLPCGARGCSRLQHTYCGSRYCPEAVDDVKGWRCEWCVREDSNHRMVEEGEEEEDSSRKRSRRAPPSHSSSPPEMKQVSSASSLKEKSTDRETRTAYHREERRESTLPTARAHASRATSPPSVSTPIKRADPAMHHHKDKHGINTRSGGGSRALDRWKNLAKRTRLGGKKYKLLADVLC